MRLINAIMIFIILFSTGIAFGNPLSNEIERNILAKDWDALDIIIAQQKNGDSLEKSDYRKLIDATTNIVSFIKAYDVCEKLINDPVFFKNPHQCYSDTINYRSKIPHILPFSHNLTDKINEMSANLHTWKKLEKKRKTEYNEIDRINKNKLTERARAVFFAAQESAFENLSYKKAEIICLACGCIADKKASEIGIARERQYSKKYGVRNLSVIDNYKRNIMSDDTCIKENKAAYFKLTNHSFATLLCKSENSCDDTAENLRRKLMRDIIDKEPEEIRSLVYKEHGFLNEQE